MSYNMDDFDLDQFLADCKAEYEPKPQSPSPESYSVVSPIHDSKTPTEPVKQMPTESGGETETKPSYITYLEHAEREQKKIYKTIIIIVITFLAVILFSVILLSSQSSTTTGTSTQSGSATTSKASSATYTASEIAETLERGLNKTPSEITYDVYAVGTTLIEVDVTIPRTVGVAARAVAGNPADWNFAVDQMNELCASLKSSVDKTGRTDISVSVMLLNEENTSRMFICSLDGVTVYDYINGIDLLD